MAIVWMVFAGAQQCEAADFAYPLSGDSQAAYDSIVNNKRPLKQALGEEGLTLLKALEYGLSNSTDVIQYRLNFEVVQAQQISASGEFNPVVSASVDRSENRSPLEDSTAALLGYDSSGSISDSTRLALSQRLRTGTNVTVSADVARYEDLLGTSTPYGTSSLRLSVSQPLLKGFGDDVSDASEKIAALSTEAQRSSLAHSISSVANNMISYFWQYVSAQESILIYGNSVGRLQGLYANLDKLIAAGAYQPTEKGVIEARLAELQSSFLAAQDYLRTSRDALGRSIGVNDEQRESIPLPVYKFSKPVPVGKAMYEKYYAYGKENREDLISERIAIKGADFNLKRAENNMLPSFDVVGSVGKTRIGTGDNFTSSLETIYEGNSADSWSLGVVFSYPLYNDAARGELVQQRASKLSRQIYLYDLERSYALGVAESFDKLESLRTQIDQAEKALNNFLDLYQKKLEAMSAGGVPLYDVLQTEQDLTNAEQSYSSLLIGYYTELQSFRFATGTLMEKTGADSIAFEDRRFMSLEFFDDK